MSGDFKRGVLMWGRQSGKTYFSTQHAWISAVLNQGRYFIVFKTYKQAHEVVWRQYVPTIPKELIHKTNEQDLLIELNYIENTPVTLPDGTTKIINHDKNLPRSTIQFLGSDQADTHRGFKGHGMIFDEYADQSPDNWDAVYKHFFTTTDGWAIFMGTPRGYNHFWELVEYAKVNGLKEHQQRRLNGEKVEDYPWFYQEATWRDSPYVKPEFIAAEKAEATKKGTLSTFMQEVELEFRAVQGAVYPDFDRKIHVISPMDIPDELTYYGAIDFGWHTTAFLLWGVDKDQTWYLVDEVYGRETTLEDLMPRIKNVIGDKRLVVTVADSQNRDAIEVMGKTMPIVGVNKANDTKGYQLGIGLVTEKLKPRLQLVGNPKPSLFVGANCKNFIFEFESYRFPEDKPERNPSDVPIKENDHGPDAARYLFLQLKHGLQTQDKPLEFDIQKQTNQYGLLQGYNYTMGKYHELHKNDPEFKAKNALRAKLWYENNKAKAQKRINERAKHTKPAKSAYDKEYYRKNREKKLAYYKQWAAENPDKPSENVRQWRAKNPLEHRLHNQARRAKTNGIKIVKEEIHNWESRICGVCHLLIEADFHIDHITPLAKDGKHEVTNLQLTHPVCNLRKHIKLPHELSIV